MNFGGRSKPRGSASFRVIRANPKPSLITKLSQTLKGALAKWH